MKLYNTMSRIKEEFKPIEQDTVKLYTCGLTVYNQPHIGNWVPYIYWDVLQRTLQTEGYDVERIQNITDVGHLVSDDDDGEDKMEKGAIREGLTAWEVAQKYIDIADREAYDELKLIQPKLVRATDRIQQQIDFVSELESKGYTYEIKGEGIYFNTSKLEDYGKLAKLDIKGLDAGARVAVAGKKNITDFALWKFSPKDQKRDMEWGSPWGTGFPGWHLECSVIAREGLGDRIDIHTGGIDHIPVHHTNEIAQTESITGQPFANFWIHNNHIKIDGGKMSKSEGNVYTLQDIKDKGYSLQAFKLMVLAKQYRTEGNFTWEILDAAQNRLNNWTRKADLVWQIEESSDTEVIDKIKGALGDDLNTPRAIKLIEKHLDAADADNKAPNGEVLTAVKTLTGINLVAKDLPTVLKQKLDQRADARKDQNWELSDEIRDELANENIGINDSGDKQLWFRIKAT